MITVSRRAIRGIAVVFQLTALALNLLGSEARGTEESAGTRIKDLARIVGVQNNALVGYGLVVGLSGTGDSASSITTNKSTATLLTRLGSVVSPKEVSTKNVAAVLVTAEMKPFARVGDKISVRISSVGDAKSLQGGTLILTPLKAADGNVYATAQGHISLGTAMAGASGGKSASEAAVRTIALLDSGTIERAFESSFLQKGQIVLSLTDPDFTTASRAAQAINTYYSAFIAKAVDSGQLQVDIPPGIFDNPSFQLVDFVATLEQIRINPDKKARVVIAERTGTIIVGNEVTIDPVAISHGFIEIQVNEASKAAQRVGELPATTTVGELVNALNSFGAGPKDLVSILQALAKSGAINAELVFL
jgi:flagellar P-ring protein precursor FlgI